jgi:hypothetical protein
LELKNSLTDEVLTRRLENSIEVLYKFFPRKTIGLLPKILEMSLEYPERTINTLRLISDFISDESFKDDETKKRLNQLRNVTTIPDDLESLLKKAREKEYSKYEKEIEGNYFSAKRTKLSLNYRCGDDIDKSFLKKVEQFRGTDDKDFQVLLKKIRDCVLSSINETVPVKADVISTKPLYIMDGDEKVKIFDAGQNFEVKKMDTELDSYLSEFFSIFKSSKLSDLKPTHLELYNKVIDGIFRWIVGIGDKYLDKIKENMAGIFYDNFTIVPIEYIDLYWSNLGQRGCNEKRLSIRFRINPDLSGKVIPIYVFNKNSDILEKKDYTVTSVNTEKKVC